MFYSFFVIDISNCTLEVIYEALVEIENDLNLNL